MRTENFNHQYPYSEFSKQQINDIFDDESELAQHQEEGDKKNNVGTQNVDGWSFVKMTQSHIEIQENMNKHQDTGGNQFSLAGNTQNS